MKRFTLSKINVKVLKKFLLLVFVSLFLLSATLGTSFMTYAAYEKTTNSDSIDPFPQADKFYTLAGRSVGWEVIDGKKVTTWHSEEIHKWSIQDVVGDVALVNRTYVEAFIQPQTSGNHLDTYDFDYEIATNRTIISARWKIMSFHTTGYLGSGEGLLSKDIGEHTWAWFPTNLYIGAYVLVSWTFDKRFLGDMLYEVVGEEAIRILGEKQDCWMLRMPPAVTQDGTEGRKETYWVDKDAGVPLKLYGQGWALDGSFGWEAESVLVNTNINLGPESTQPPSPTYTLTVPTTPGFPEAGKFWSWYLLEEGCYLSGATNVTYYTEGLLIWWVVNVTDGDALVCSIYWGDFINHALGIEELEAVDVYYRVYNINVTTRRILDVNGTVYGVNMTSLTYEGPFDLTPQLVADIGEETYVWLPTNLYVGAAVNMTWTRDRPSGLDNATYTVIDEKIILALGEPQDSWVLYLPQTPSTDGTWNHTETFYSDKDAGIPLYMFSEGEAVDGNSAYVSKVSLMDTNVDLGPKTYVFPVVADAQTFQIVVVTNSTVPVQTFNFNKEEIEISYNVTGPSGTKGFCNVTIPKNLLTGEPWLILLNVTTPRNFIKTTNDTHTFLYFDFNHSTHLVEIIGTWVVSEFPVVIIMPLFLIATLLGVMVYRRKQTVDKLGHI